jgi:hypothetical protein
LYRQGGKPESGGAEPSLLAAEIDGGKVSGKMAVGVIAGSCPGISPQSRVRIERLQTEAVKYGMNGDLGFGTGRRWGPD